MTKKTYPQATLVCMMQHDEPQAEHRCCLGLLSREGENAFRFEETLAPRRHAAARLMEGRYVRLSRRRDGHYALTLNALVSPAIDIEQLAWAIYTELLQTKTLIHNHHE